ncbi:zinc finger CCHC domain-containing protein 7-like [Oppia nitens]|uniref:zinc finger CCHC domain-containing protein 7-like n=1 Tax=Oppia nitens TaxID=1686743 RepID=UPI0023D9A72F|nr:zinc finger CCHC domain-containing protein 7-like [Oppia nitens]
MDVLNDSDDCSRYNSDEISSDLEVELYGAIHHSFADTIDGRLNENNSHLPIRLEEKIKSIDKRQLFSLPKSEVNDNNRNNSYELKLSSNKPLTNLFTLLAKRYDMDEDIEDIDSGVEVINNVDMSCTKRKIELIELNDNSSDDSDVVIIDNNRSHCRNDIIRYSSPKKTSPTKQSPKCSPIKSSDISFGNVSNLNETTLSSSMDQFYNEDDYDSEEERAQYKRMSGDRSLWRISYNDLLVNNTRSNRYYRNKMFCNNCKERGHQARDCPIPKKLPICYMCGQSGHVSEKCKSIICSICLSSKHKTSYCNLKVNALVCEVCNKLGHKTNQCTYNWRKYHLTTTFTSQDPVINNLSANLRKCCYNCGAIGKHFGFECHIKGISKHMSPVSPLMSSIRRTHCFNSSKDNNNRRRNDCNKKALCNEFVKSISSNELSCLSASFNKPLDELNLSQTSATSTPPTTHLKTTFNNNNKNKHIKWIYYDRDVSNSSDSSDIEADQRHQKPKPGSSRNGLNNRSIGEQRILNETSFSRLNDNNTILNAFEGLRSSQTPAHRTIDTSGVHWKRHISQHNIDRSKKKRNKHKKLKTDQTVTRNDNLFITEYHMQSTVKSKNNWSNRFKHNNKKKFQNKL